ncbi:ROK family protein [Flavihumibacter sp. CACIAM 22H1]|uniref:ROK family protein n=1 Tax=Flavihumibacter sp. CACIAM 22H1 TaxID=1812911 RepID=UPI0007A8A860|nr:ROK family protein [Flavihumibacter sp. CACIAM 22H1]KYP14452.1 MAG: sugar kinase [Flavihumibacter sp. CACIAM 22H1]
MASKSEVYKARILKELCFGKMLSASEISVRMQKSLPLTVRMLNELVEEDVIIEKGYAPSTGGRRPQTYALTPGRMYAIAVAMDQLVTKIALVDLQNFERINERRFSLVLSENPQALDELVQLISSYIREISVPFEKLQGVGIGMPGFIDITKGVNYSYLDNQGKSLHEKMEKELGLPVFIDNDSSLIALAELRAGDALNKSNVMVINISWGIGLGMILNGSLFRGYNGFAGEFSHIPLFNNNKLCECGKSGCLETEASLKVMVAKAQEGMRSGRVTSIKFLPDDIEEACKMVINAANRGDQLAVELLSDVAYNIGRGIAVLVHIMNPEQVVFSGRGAAAGKLLLPPIQQALNRYCIPRLAAYTHLSVSDLNKDAEIMGAAALVVEQLDKRFTNRKSSSKNHPFAA